MFRLRRKLMSDEITRLRNFIESGKGEVIQIVPVSSVVLTLATGAPFSEVTTTPPIPLAS